MTKGKRKTVNVDDGVDDCWRWLIQRGPAAIFATVAVFALLVRAAVSLHPYSGAGHPPKYGDYEAQRHWMEITLNLPVREWYRNSTTNDLSYWGLDYPPLTAYQSFIHGLFLRFFHPDSVSLFSSRGHESYLGKLLMRWTVLSSDALIFFPSIIYFIIVYYNQPSRCHKRDIWWHTALLLLNPCLILIDHGHFQVPNLNSDIVAFHSSAPTPFSPIFSFRFSTPFFSPPTVVPQFKNIVFTVFQFNCISLGLSTGAVAAILSGQDLFACVLYCLAINHKQMSIYFAPAFFSHLLGKCLRHKYPPLEVAKLGVVVLGTFAAVWWPYLYSMESILEVLSRLAPFERGIYEDYVANFWCTSSILIKWKKLFTTQSLKLVSFTATVLACLPSMTQQIKSPSNQGFLYGLLTSSISFYLFSFQVHEKSILLPLLPASLLAVEEPFLFRWFMQFAMFSMFPLICRDGLVLAYLASFALFILIFFAPGQNRNEESSYYFSTRIMRLILNVLCFILHVVYLVMRPPEKYPFLFEALIMNLCFSQFVLVALCTNLKQWMLDNHVKLE